MYTIAWELQTQTNKHYTSSDAIVFCSKSKKDPVFQSYDARIVHVQIKAQNISLRYCQQTLSTGRFFKLRKSTSYDIS